MPLSLRSVLALLLRPIDLVTRRHRIVAHLLRSDARLLEIEERMARLEAENWRLERMQLATTDFYERRLDLIYRNVSRLHDGRVPAFSGQKPVARQG